MKVFYLYGHFILCNLFLRASMKAKSLILCIVCRTYKISYLNSGSISIVLEFGISNQYQATLILLFNVLVELKQSTKPPLAPSEKINFWSIWKFRRILLKPLQTQLSLCLWRVIGLAKIEFYDAILHSLFMLIRQIKFVSLIISTIPTQLILNSCHS